MKRGTPEHPKMRRLQRRLDIPLWQAIGLLEALWHFTARAAPCGDIGKWSDEDIAAALDWRDAPAALVAALVEVGWVDRSKRFRLVTHDWHEHCDQAVRRLIERNGWEFASLYRHDEPCLDISTSCEDTGSGSCISSGSSEGGCKGETEQAGVREPVAVSAATPNGKSEPRKRREYDPEFERAWEAWGFKGEKGAAAREFAHALTVIRARDDPPPDPDVWLTERAAMFARLHDAGNEKCYRKDFERWLKNKGYDFDERGVRARIPKTTEAKPRAKWSHEIETQT